MRQQGIRHPARLVPTAFLVAIAIGTAVLMLPMARAGPGGAPLLTALFTATSAVCVTGLSTVVDTPTYWSPFGLAAILALFQIGGFGIMTGATLLGMLAGRRLRLSARLVAHAERGTLDTADMLGVLKLILIVTLVIELAMTAWLTLVLRLGHGLPWAEALWDRAVPFRVGLQQCRLLDLLGQSDRFPVRRPVPRADHARHPGRARSAFR